MAITTYTTLSAAVQSFMLGRTDLATPMPELVMSAEHLLFHGSENMDPLRIRKMETIGDITMTDGVGPLPAAYLQWKQVVEKSSPRRILDNVPKDVAEQRYGSHVSGPGMTFWVLGDNLYTAPLVSNDIELTYYAKPTALDSADPDVANAFLSVYPLLYLRACQVAACEWLKDWEEMQIQAGFLKGLVYSLNREAMVDSMAKTGLSFRKQVR